MDRATTAAEVEQGCFMLYQRLGRALDALDDGDVSAADDLAGILRTLIADGKGDAAIFRLASRRGIGMGAVLTSRHIESKLGMVLGVGRVPVQRRAGAPVFARSFEEWVRGTAIRMPGARTREYSWGDFVTVTGNTVGSHLSVTIPQLLDQSRVANVAGFTLHHYLLRQVGWQTEVTLGAMLQSRGHPVREAARAVEVFNVLVGLFTLYEQGKAFGVNGEFSASAYPAEILALQWRGNYFRVAANDDGKLEITAPAVINFDAEA